MLGLGVMHAAQVQCQTIAALSLCTFKPLLLPRLQSLFQAQPLFGSLHGMSQLAAIGGPRQFDG